MTTKDYRMYDDLEQMTDEHLNELFAIEVAGWTRMHSSLPSFSGWMDGDMPKGRTLHFATSADAVLPWLEKRAPYVSIGIYGTGWCVTIFDHNFNNIWTGVNMSFARAVCIALIRFKKITK